MCSTTTPSRTNVRDSFGKCTIGDGVPHASMTHAMQPEHESALARHRFLLLFLLLLGTLILYPYADASRFGHYAFRVIGSAATLISVYAAKIHRTLLVFALILAIPTLFQRILIPEADASSFSIFNIVLKLCFRHSHHRGYFPPRVRQGTGQLGNHLRSPLYLSAGRVQFCQCLRHGSDPPDPKRRVGLPGENLACFRLIVHKSCGPPIWMVCRASYRSLAFCPV
jgi:hypothetical protein